MNTNIKLYVPPGKHVPTIEHYAALLLPFEIEDNHCRINQNGCVASENFDSLCLVQTDDNHFSLLPGPEFSPRLYRGQSFFYEDCLPSLYRKPMTQIKYLTDLLKKYEFYKLMADHPIVRCLSNWHIDGKYFKVDMEGLAAHYEFSTSMIDLSRSKNVAMFFALCEKKKGQYEPIVDESREVVLYSINLKALIESNCSDLHVIGFQALPRPDAQKAYSLWLGDRQNLNECHFVRKEMLKVHRKESEKYFDMFEGGAKLFPIDIVDKMALELRQSMEIDKEVLESCFARHLIPKKWGNLEDINKFLSSHRYLVREKQLEFTDEVKRNIVENWHSNSPLFLDRIKCRFVSRRESPSRGVGTPIKL